MHDFVITPSHIREATLSRYRDFVRPVIAAAIIGVAYYFGARLGLALTFQPHPVSPLWPPNSILLAALLLAPTRWWWFLLIAVFPVHLLVEANAGVPLSMILCWFISNCSEALIGATVVRLMVHERTRLDSTYEVSVFIVAALVGPFLSSFLDAFFVSLNQFGESDYWDVFRMRCLSNVLAAVTIAPLIITWGTGGRPLFRSTSLSRCLEAAAVAFGLLIVSIISFDSGTAAQSMSPALLYLPLPFLLWTAIRFGPRGITCSLVAVSLCAIWGAIHGFGPFVIESPEVNALQVQLFLIFTSIPLLFLAVVIKERWITQKALLQSEDRYRNIVESQSEMICRYLPDTTLTYVNDAYCRCFGKSRDQLIGSQFVDLIPEEAREQTKRDIESIVRNARTETRENEALLANGRVGWQQWVNHAIPGPDGNIVELQGVGRDITEVRLANLALTQSEEKLRRSYKQISALAGKLITAQESERRRIARQLHDDLNQKIATVSVMISKFKKKSTTSGAYVSADLAQIEEQINELTTDVRRISHRLHPVVLEHLGLVPGLQAYIDELQMDEGIDVVIDAFVGDEKIPVEKSVGLYRVAVEALRNVVRHSGANRAGILLRKDDDWIELQVSDSGQGFDTEAAARGEGLGLVSMDERVKLLRGTFEVSSILGTGTTVRARVPLNS